MSLVRVSSWLYARPASFLRSCARNMSSGLLSRPVDRLSDATGSATQFNILTYNILSDSLLQQHQNLYESCESQCLPWEYRSPRLLGEILSYDADVLCLQEVEERHFRSTLLPGLKKEGYSGFHVARNGDHPDGCATFFRTSKFDVLEHVPVEYRKPNSRLLDRNNVASLLLLRCKSEYKKEKESKGKTAAGRVDHMSEVMLVANTHLLFNPKRGDVKLAQIMLLMAEIQRLSNVKSGGTSAGSAQHHPVVLVGDFNLVPYSPLYWFLVTGELFFNGVNRTAMSGQERARGMNTLISATPQSFLPADLGISNRCAYEDLSLGLRQSGAPSITHPFGLASSYQHFFSRDEPEFTTRHDVQCATVDYIFFSSNQFSSKAGQHRLDYKQQLQLLGRRRLLRQRDLRKLGSLPNAAYSSDHLAIQAYFQFCKTGAGQAIDPPPPIHSSGGRKRFKH